MNFDRFNRRLDPGNFYKPLDFGNGLVAGSVAPDGRLLALSTYHPIHGYVTLGASAPFPDDRRYDQAAVRAYRAALAQPDAPTFGLRIPSASTPVGTYLLADAIPNSRFQVDSLTVRVVTWAPQPNPAEETVPAALQMWQFHNPTEQPVTLDYVWEGPLALTRASYTQLTERGSLTTPTTALRLTFDGHELNAVASDVGAAAVILGLPSGSPWQQTGHSPLPITTAGRLTVPPAQTEQLILICALGETLDQARATATALQNIDPQSSLTTMVNSYRSRWQKLDPDVADSAGLMAHRAQAYVLDCCALPVNEGICLLTDHQILPLSWTRDAYFLLQGLHPGTEAMTLEIVRRHLIWLFEIALRPNGYWGRAYLTTGQPKDHIFQLDQQCYPLLELVEYAALTIDEVTVERLTPHLPTILDTILARQASSIALFETEETPADDPLSLPYHFSSQVLLWHTLHQLAAFNTRWPFTSLDLASLATDIHTATRQFLVAKYQDEHLFAYATDLRGNYRFYHDANDLPTVLAPLWGFCAVDDPIWQATMEFAFSSANAGGYYPGPVGGLGSVHTPGPWPLGDVQELLYARLIDNPARAQTVIDQLVVNACWDGALPEARDENSGAVRSRHWFAWPNAALLAALTHPAWQPP